MLKRFSSFLLALLITTFATFADVLYQSDALPEQDRFMSFSTMGYDCWLFDTMTGDLTKIEPDFNNPEKTKYKKYTGIPSVSVSGSRIGRFKFTLMSTSSKIQRITILDSDTGKLWISTSTTSEFSELIPKQD